MDWTILNFGKHKGKTLPQVMFIDPDWFFWAYKNSVFKNMGNIETEAKNILAKAMAIRIPEINGKKYFVRYKLHKPRNKFANLELILADYYNYLTNKPNLVFDRINMQFPLTLKQYDKSGFKRLLYDMKKILFGSIVRMTKNKCEEFFSNDANFVLAS